MIPCFVQCEAIIASQGSQSTARGLSGLRLEAFHSPPFLIPPGAVKSEKVKNSCFLNSDPLKPIATGLMSQSEKALSLLQMHSQKNMKKDRRWEQTFRSEICHLRNQYSNKHAHDQEKIIDDKIAAEHTAVQIQQLVSMIELQMQQQECWKDECVKVLLSSPCYHGDFNT